MTLVQKKAPDFQAQAYHAGDVRDLRLSDLRGRWVVLVFYPLDFTFVCPTELRAFAADHEAFARLNAEIVAVSTDSVYCHKAWFERDLPAVRYPVASDMTRRIARDYGVLDEENGFALRGTFVIDPEGVVQYEVVAGPSIGRSTEDTLRVLQALQTKQMCPANWRPGAKTLGGA